MSHAWPIILVLILVFGGGIVRAFFRMLGGGVSVAAKAAMAPLAEQLAETLREMPGDAAQSQADAVRLALARVTSPDQTRRLAPAVEAMLVAAAERAVPAERAVSAERAVPVAKPARHKPPKPAVSTPRHTIGNGAVLAPLPALKKRRPLPVAAPLAVLAARAPLAPLSPTHH